MKRTFYLLALAATVALAACTREQEQTDHILVSGTAQTTGDLYLYEVIDEHYGYIRQVDTLAVSDGKISYECDTIKPGLYFITTAGKDDLPEAIRNGHTYFLSKGKNILSWSDTEQTLIGSPINEEYQAFVQKKEELENKAQIDSISELFYAARDRDDREEMERLNEVSNPIYDEGKARMKAWLGEQLDQQRKDLFGIYLYYTYDFSRTAFETMDEVKDTRAYVEGFDADAKASAYYDKMIQTLDYAEKTVIGATAPDIWGETPDGGTARLTDLRGKAVLIDFWSSTCSWCRAETPNLQEVYNRYKDKGFTILGVSSDFKREAWIKAVEEDGAVWDHLLLSEEDRNKILNDYSVSGIPLILLVDREGKIVARDLRGEDIIDAVTEYMEQN